MKAFDSVETEAVTENQGVPTKYRKIKQAARQLTMSSSVRGKNLSTRQLLPTFANAKVAHIRSMGYDIYWDQEKRLVYKYSVSWTDETDEAHAIWRSIIKKLINSGKVAIKVPVRCDGPCGGYTGLDQIFFGLCEHSICRKCYEATDTVGYDGFRTCCNAECMRLAKEARSRKRSAKSSEKTSPKEAKSDISYTMKYDNKELQEAVDAMEKAQKSHFSHRTDTSSSSNEPAFPQC
ncbi:hypothetical protein RB195_009033 [Necator americanus]|uniref:Uncharacterized protein n=1 Tax=Necator americanus TaxID=51031 RepID=A0ABR1CRG1_NECAM